MIAIISTGIGPYSVIVSSIDSSVNRPKFCPFISWNPNGITWVNDTMTGVNPSSVFVDQNNRIFVYATNIHQIIYWSSASILPLGNISCYPCITAQRLFVTTNGDIYADNGVRGRVEKRSPNATSYTIALSVLNSCYGLFVDRNNSVYCSIYRHHQVVKNSIVNNPNHTVAIAGNGILGADTHLLANPCGIFVDDNFNLYVADSLNNRIQRFDFGSNNGTTVAGNGLMGSLTLLMPMDVILDANGYMFILDTGNHRIIGSGPLGFRCIVGCSGSGSSANQLNSPISISFDSTGNLFVADWFNSRIQKFLLATNSCGEFLSH